MSLPRQPSRRLPMASVVSLVAVVLLALGAAQGIGWWSERRTMTQLRELARPGDIEMFTRADCLWCERAARRLDEAGVPWRECRIDLDPNCARRHADSGGFGTPWFKVADRWRAGFDPSWIVLVLKQRPQTQP